MIDVSDDARLSDLYDTTLLTINDDGTFVYLKQFNNKGKWNEKKDDPTSFILKTDYVFRYALENGELKEKEVDSDSDNQFIATLLDDNTISLSEYDSFTGKPKANESPILFVREDVSSTYLANNKTPLNNNSGNTSPGSQTENNTPSSKPSTNATTGEKNALRKAYDYLNYTAFSYEGLIEQLEFEGYSHSEAKYAADNCGADWKEQAAQKALDYLDYSAFSYSGLIEQLEYEGFTTSEATYGVDNCGANWNDQARQKAKDYLEFSSFSKKELIDQLIFEGFTKSQAESAVNDVY